jgi:outer membrane protein with beta-barrel domain
MKKFSPNITDGELQELFREAAENYEPLYSRCEKEALWARIRAAGRATHPRSITKKFLFWLPSFLVILFLGASLRMSDGLLQPGKGYASRKPEPTWTKDREEIIRESGPIPADKTPGISEAIPRRTEIDRRRSGDETSGIPRPVELPVLAEVGKGRSGTKDRWDSVEGGKGEQGRAGVPGGKGEDRATKGAAVVPGARSRDDRKGWSIGATLGTDWSMVKNDENERPGLDWGMMVGYRFARRWSVESGLSVASKIYSTPPQDYHSGVSYPGLVSVDARCRVFDLPINVRYDVLQRGNSTLFASTGLSSFWMQKEDYTYNINSNGGMWISKMTIYNRNRYFLSIVNFALGYEFAWNKFSVQASPYLKLPLTGIGYGKVDLKSTGILMTLKRRL